jgi:thiamine biosynthesis lipoprotein
MPITVSPVTKKYLDIALGISADSGGAFDPTVGYLTRLWGIDEGNEVIPDDAEIQNLVRNVGYENISLEGDTVTMPAEVSIDFGAIGKGIGSDEIEKLFIEKLTVKGAIVNLGGSSILTFGEKSSGEDWKVAITNPTKVEDFLCSIKLSGTNHISTSGDYEKYFEVDGKRYHHILDPGNGYPVDNGLRSVTVISKSGAISDGLSTACFVLGKVRGEALLRKYSAEAIFVDKEKNVSVTEGLQDQFELLADDYKVI